MNRIQSLREANKVAQENLSPQDEESLILIEANNDLEQSSLSFFNISRWQSLEVDY